MFSAITGTLDKVYFLIQSSAMVPHMITIYKALLGSLFLRGKSHSIEWASVLTELESMK